MIFVRNPRWRMVIAALWLAAAQLQLLVHAPLHAQPLTHEPTGITLPEEIAGFKRMSYQDFEAKQAGLGAGYHYSNGQGAAATVYIYTAGQTNIPPGVDSPMMARMREQTLREIIEFAKQRNELTEHQSQSRVLVKTESADLPVLFDALVITGPGGARDTLAWLWGTRGHFLKIRITRLPKGELPQSQIDAFYEFVVRSSAN